MKENTLLNKKTYRENPNDPENSIVLKNEESFDSSLIDVINSLQKCFKCERNLTNSIKIIYNFSKEKVLCIDCLMFSEWNNDLQNHEQTFTLIDKPTKCLFTSQWTIKEELMLITGKFIWILDFIYFF